MSGTDSISGGYDTARLSAAEQDRLAREERVPGRKYRRVNGHRVAS